MLVHWCPFGEVKGRLQPVKEREGSGDKERGSKLQSISGFLVQCDHRLLLPPPGFLLLGFLLSWLAHRLIHLANGADRAAELAHDICAAIRIRGQRVGTEALRGTRRRGFNPQVVEEDGMRLKRPAATEVGLPGLGTLRRAMPWTGAVERDRTSTPCGANPSS